MNKKNKLTKKIFLLCIIVLIIIIGILMYSNKEIYKKIYGVISNVNLSNQEEETQSAENIDISKDINISTKYYDTNSVTQEYLSYMKLSKEEKAKVNIIPNKYKVSMDLFNNSYVKKLYEPTKVQDALEMSTFDLRTQIGDLNVENQESSSLCWAYMVNKALETNIKLDTGEEYDFSETYLDYILSSNIYGASRNVGEGGYSSEAIRIMCAKGAVTEDIIPDGNTYSGDYSAIKEAECAKRITQFIVFPYMDKDTPEAAVEEIKGYIKSHISEYGGITAVINSPEEEMGYNKSSYAYCSAYDDLYTEYSHGITIVGWDDNFSRSKFTKSGQNAPKKNGAWLAVNSWGTSWGDKGYYWISYEDANIYKEMYGIISTTDTHPYAQGYKYNTYYPNSNFTLKCGNVVSNPSDGEYVVKFNRRPEELEYIDYVVVCATGEAYVNVNLKDGLQNGEFTSLEDDSSEFSDLKDWLVYNPSSELELTGQEFAVNVKFEGYDNEPENYGLYAADNTGGSTYLKNENGGWDSLNKNIQVIAFTHSYEISNIQIDTYPKQTYSVGEKLNLDNGIVNVTYKDGTVRKVKLSECNVTGYDENNADTQTLTVEYYGKKTSYEVTVNAKSINNATVTLSDNTYVYDGEEKQPTVTVKDGETKLIFDQDYTLEYSNNRDVGIAQVKVKGKGNYSGEKIENFTITAATIEVVVKGYNGKCDGVGHGIVVNVIKPLDGYVIRYGTQDGTYDLESSPTYQNAGTYTIYYQITADNYETKTGSEIVRLTSKSIEEVTVTLSDNTYVYDGEEKQPTVTVEDEGKELIFNQDYTLEYSNNRDVGTAHVKVIGQGEYSGEKVENFTITAATMEVVSEGYEGEYDGDEHGITVNVTKPSNGYVIQYGNSTGEYTLESSPTYQDAGTYTVYYQITANNYETKTGEETVKINAKNIEKTTVILPEETYTYNKQEKRPIVTLRDDERLLEQEKDYSVEYSNNTNAGQAEITIEGIDNYTGSITENFTIYKADPSYSPPTGLIAKYGQTLNDIALPSGFSWESDLTTKVGEPGENTFTVRYTPNDINNYNIIEGIRVTIIVLENLNVEFKEYDTDEENGTTYVENITPDTNMQKFINNIETNGTVKLYNKNDEQITDMSKILATGMVIRITKNDEEKVYTIVVTGDLTGDGILNGVDLLKLARYRVNLDKNLQGAYLRASDVLKDNVFADSKDLLKLARVIVKLDTL